METKQTKDSTKQVKHDKNLYELILYVVGNNKKIQLSISLYQSTPRVSKINF